ncbi:branched-chain amino acid ABC transporter permease [Thermogemmatispora sp.]|uniref:branched-chain amino acid ABC transporter permease n=1 Tax=Thermogemmatispora sp. TaxID=1968838 RepID=UPI001DAE9E79|nr:branched-chain amino acid ABC transporter permease [Thermogemmatispora sp.]MBX5448637.1 branched-chain amino acid ABC transporter permease [Thermogemmatispora sp.]
MIATREHSHSRHHRQELPREAEPPRLLGSPGRWLWLGVGVLALLLFFSLAGDDWFTIVNYCLIAAIATLALNLLSGYTGQISLGLAFFMGLGGYTAALLGGNPPVGPLDPWGLGLPVFVWLPAAGLVAALVGALVGPSALRLRGFYLGIVTLALVFIGNYLFRNLRFITGGPQGRNFPVPTFGSVSLDQQNSLLGIALTSGQQYFLLMLLVLLLSALFVYNLSRSRVGRAMRAVRDHEVGAAIMGVNLFEVKMGAFVVSSFLAGVAGALYVSYARYVIPDYWSLSLSIQFVAAIIIGGIADVWGSILGAAFVFALPQIIDYFSLLPPSTGGGGLSSGDLNALLYGLLIIVFLLFEPGGVIGLLRRLRPTARRLRPVGAGVGKAAVNEGGENIEVVDLLQHAPESGEEGRGPRGGRTS